MSDITCWPFKEAKQILARRKKIKQESKQILFETGYGPSGLPHIGTFAEVFRTTMVRQAFEYLTGEKTQLYVFSDDMDGMRKIPTNVPNQELLYKHLNKPLTSVPDPFGQYESFAAHNNAMLCRFLDYFGFKYEFKSSTDMYKSGAFNETIIKILDKYDQIMEIMLPSLGKERQKTYSPFLPICKQTGQVLQVPMIEIDYKNHAVIYLDSSGNKVKTSVLDGNCKLQWKVDWAMRWIALGVDYEMNGKDLVDSTTLSYKIASVLNYEPPANLTYELFLDETGHKISKSKGNGITIDDWFKYGTKESLSFYMFQSPTKAKKLAYNVIPRAMSDYLVHLEKYQKQTYKEHLENPIWHIHNGNPPDINAYPISFNMLINLANIFHTNDEKVIWSCLQKHNCKINSDFNPKFSELVQKAIKYYNDIIKAEAITCKPNPKELSAIKDLITCLEQLPTNATSEQIQEQIYNVGNKYQFNPLRDWFKFLYTLILGQSDGPRLGSLILIYGLSKSIIYLKKIVSLHL